MNEDLLLFFLSNMIAFALVPIVIYLIALCFRIVDMTNEYKLHEKRRGYEIFKRGRK